MAQVFESADLDVVSDFLGKFYSSMRLNAVGERRGFRITQEQTPRVLFSHVTYRMRVDVDGDPLGAVCIGRMLDGRISYSDAGGERRYQRGDVFLIAQPDAPFHTRIDDVETQAVFLDPTLLREVAQGPPGDREPVRLRGYEPLTSARGEQWWRVCATVTSSLDSSPDLLASPLVVANAARLLAAITLATFPNSAVVDPTIEDRHDAHPDALRRAVAFIEAHPDRDLTIADIAAAAVVSVRAVQLAFQRHLDTTPMGYLRTVRLDRAHRDLVAADPERDTVTDIALRWGFAHLSRFAGYYRKAYGVSPSQTLQQPG